MSMLATPLKRSSAKLMWRIGCRTRVTLASWYGSSVNMYDTTYVRTIVCARRSCSPGNQNALRADRQYRRQVKQQQPSTMELSTREHSDHLSQNVSVSPATLMTTPGTQQHHTERAEEAHEPARTPEQGSHASSNVQLQGDGGEKTDIQKSTQHS